MLMFQDGVLSFTECSSAIRTLGLRQSGIVDSIVGLVDYLPAVLTVQTGLMKQKINSLPATLTIPGPDYAKLSPG